MAFVIDVLGFVEEAEAIEVVVIVRLLFGQSIGAVYEYKMTKSNLGIGMKPST